MILTTAYNDSKLVGKIENPPISHMHTINHKKVNPKALPYLDWTKLLVYLIMIYMTYFSLFSHVYRVLSILFLSRINL